MSTIQAEAQTHTGTVKWYSDEKGYGFILPDGGGPDIFVHVTAVTRSNLKTLKKDARITFEIKDNKGRPNAIKLAME